MRKVNEHLFHTEKNIANISRRNMRDLILDKAKKACESLGVMADIGEGYVVVNTAMYKVTEK